MTRIELALGLMLLAGAGSARAQETEAGPASLAGKAGIEWTRIPGGSFAMGSADSDLLRTKPVHRVKVKPFQMAKTLVTNKQYKACVAAGACTAAHASDGTCSIYNGKSWGPGNLPDSFQGDDQPAVCVDWTQAKRFAKWAGGRLPTEAEWEYAARSAGKDQLYPWGNGQATCSLSVSLGCGAATATVCSQPAGNTRQGLCDMAGNAWEWVEDGHHDSYKGAPSDGSAWEAPAGSFRVFRGGAWDYDFGNARSAVRYYYPPERRNNDLGFRLAR